MDVPSLFGDAFLYLFPHAVVRRFTEIIVTWWNKAPSFAWGLFVLYKMTLDGVPNVELAMRHSAPRVGTGVIRDKKA